MVASISICRAFMTRSNIVSQIVQVLGFMRLGRMPTARNGTEAKPRQGTGNFSVSQQPLQRSGCDAIGSFPQDRERVFSTKRTAVNQPEPVKYAADARAQRAPTRGRLRSVSGGRGW